MSKVTLIGIYTFIVPLTFILICGALFTAFAPYSIA